ncbi:MAG: hypothetical protein ABEJ61_04930 [Haloferacaceae archaeon]
MFDEWPDEPDEPDPEADLRSPEEEEEEELTRVPSAPSPDVEEAEVDPELLTTWWRSVALANLALGAVAVGLLLVAFRRMWLVGGASVALGLLAGVRLVQHYRAFERRRGDDGADGTPHADEGDGAAADEGATADAERNA